MFVLAHAGHWFESVLYLAPVAILVVALFLSGRRDDNTDAEDSP